MIWMVSGITFGVTAGIILVHMGFVYGRNDARSGSGTNRAVARGPELDGNRRGSEAGPR